MQSSPRRLKTTQRLLCTERLSSSLTFHVTPRFKCHTHRRGASSFSRVSFFLGSTPVLRRRCRSRHPTHKRITLTALVVGAYILFLLRFFPSFFETCRCQRLKRKTMARAAYMRTTNVLFQYGQDLPVVPA